MKQANAVAALVTLIFVPPVFCERSAAGPEAQPAASATQCILLHDGVEYRTYLPDGRRFVYVAVKVIPGIYPSVFVLADKNYDAPPHTKVSDSDPIHQWWIDRSRPFAFATDKVRIRWEKSGTIEYVTSLFMDRDVKEFSQGFRGLEKANGRYEGTGSSDINAFAFQTRIEMTGFRGDIFEVKVPDVTFDGITVKPPVVQFEREDNAIRAKC